MWIGENPIIDTESLNQYFVNFDDMEEGCVESKSDWYYSDPNDYKMSKEVSAWCRSSHIKYRKVKTSEMVVQLTDGSTYNHEVRLGLLFYRMEDAMAFKLRWC